MPAKKKIKANSADVHLVMVLDRSGSMQDKWPDTVGGFKRLLEDQLATGEKLGARTLVTFTHFDTVYEVVKRHAQVDMTTYATILDGVYPRGMTALFDAVGQTITSVDEYQATADAPAKVVFVILTDGEENSSHEYTGDQVKALIQGHKDWEFIYIGAGESAYTGAKALAVPITSTISGATSGVAMAATYDSLISNVRGYRAGKVTTTAWTAEQKADVENK